MISEPSKYHSIEDGFEPEPTGVSTHASEQDSKVKNSATLQPDQGTSSGVSFVQFLQCIFSAEKRSEICQALEAQGRSSPAAKAVYLLYAAAGCFFFLNTFVLFVVASDIQNKVCEDSTSGALIVTVASASILSILWFIWNKSLTSALNNLFFFILVTGLLVISAIIHSDIQVNPQCYLARDSELWDTYLGFNWVLTSALIIEAYVARVPWVWFFCGVIAPFFKSFLIWSDLNVRRTLLQRAFANDPDLVSPLPISAKSVHKMMKLVMFVYMGLCTLFILGIAQYVSDYDRYGFDRVAEEYLDYAVFLLVVMILTLIYLPLPFLVPFAAGFKPILQAVMFILVSSLVSLTIVAENIGEESANYVSLWVYLNRWPSADSFKGLQNSRWYLHFSWLLLAPLFVDCIVMIVTSCRRNTQRAEGQQPGQIETASSAGDKEPFLVVSS